MAVIPTDDVKNKIGKVNLFLLNSLISGPVTVKTLKELKPDRGKTSLVPLQIGCRYSCDAQDCS